MEYSVKLSGAVGVSLAPFANFWPARCCCDAPFGACVGGACLAGGAGLLVGAFFFTLNMLTGAFFR